MALCYCCSAVDFAHCCAPFLQGQQAATPEQLMRSRYTAFVLKNGDYLLRTLHPSQHKPDEHAQLAQAFGLTWLGLRVLHAAGDRVEFCAFYAAPRGLGQLHENSRFVRENGEWFYVDGEFLPSLKLQRNDSCPCGSGQKYKKCHGL